LSNIYDDGTPISFLKNNNNNAFLKNKSSNFSNNAYVGSSGSSGSSGAYNKNKVILSNESENGANGANVTISSEVLITDTHDTPDTVETNSISNPE
jgi:hypothetical protein